MRKATCFILVVFVFLAMSTPAFSSEATFDPNAQWFTMNSEGVLSLWGVTEANGNALVANPDYGWPTELAIATWYTTLLKAQERSLVVVVGYDPVTYDIWYMSKPQ